MCLFLENSHFWLIFAKNAAKKVLFYSDTEQFLYIEENIQANSAISLFSTLKNKHQTSV